MVFTSSKDYNLSYDSFGNASGVSVGDNTLATYEYYPNNGKLKKSYTATDFLYT